MRRVLVLAAHPDDEVLGAGGAMARHAAEGDEVHCVIVASGATSRGAGPEVARYLGELEQQAKRVGACLGARETRLEGLADQLLDTLPMLELAKRVTAHVERVQPELVYTHHRGDLNEDHARVCRAAMIACRAMPGCGVREFWMWETLSSTEWSSRADPFEPTLYCNIEAQLDRKLEALSIYKDELRPYPHPRSLEGVRVLAAHRGLEVGLRAAEAFQAFRLVR